jgi:hypothetical protein
MDPAPVTMRLAVHPKRAWIFAEGFSVFGGDAPRGSSRLRAWAAKIAASEPEQEQGECGKAGRSKPRELRAIRMGLPLPPQSPRVSNHCACLPENFNRQKHFDCRRLRGCPQKF